MGGYSFRTRETGEIAYMNLPNRNIWAGAVIAAKETGVLDSAKCSFDEDGECQRRGCLNEDGKRGWQLPLRAFLFMNQRVLAFAELYPNQLPDVEECLYPNGDKDCAPGSKYAIPLLRHLITVFEAALEKGEKEIFMYDRLSDPDAYPCPRSWDTARLPNTEEIDEYLKSGIGIPGKIIEERIMSYDEAMDKQSNGEWKAMIEEVWSSS